MKYLAPTGPVVAVVGDEYHLKALKSLEKYGLQREFFPQATPFIQIMVYDGEAVIDGVKIRVQTTETLEGSSMSIFSHDSKALEVLKNSSIGKYIKPAKRPLFFETH